MLHARLSSLLAHGVLAVLMVAGTVAAAPQPSGLRLVVSAPDAVEVDASLDVTMRLEGPAGRVDAAEIRLGVDTRAAPVNGGAPGVLGGDVPVPARALGPVAHAAGVALATVPCGPSSCGAAATERGTAAGGLGTISLLPETAGALVLRPEPAIVVLDGVRHEVAPATDEIVVQVGDDTTRIEPPLPTAPQVTLERPSSVRPDAVADALDADGDGDRDAHDAVEAELLWTDARTRGAPMTGDRVGDVDGDRVVDVTDVLAVRRASTVARSTARSSVPGVVGAAARAGAASAGPDVEPQDEDAADVPAGGTFVVDSVGDEPDVGVPDGVCRTAAGTCTLRAAIREANADQAESRIYFDLPAGEVHTIQLESRLPTLADPGGGTHIEGFTQPGSDPDTRTILIEVRGRGAEAFDGLSVVTADNVIDGIAFYDLRVGVRFYGPEAQENALVRSFVGTDAALTFRHEEWASGAFGIEIRAVASSNRVGMPIGLWDEDDWGVVVAGNANHGIRMADGDGNTDGSTNVNSVYYSFVGIAPDGTAIGNLGDGVHAEAGVDSPIVHRSVVSANQGDGVQAAGQLSRGLRVRDSRIGTTPDGRRVTDATGNGDAGVKVGNGHWESNITDNVIAGNVHGVELNASDEVYIQGNRIGMTGSGEVVGNAQFGIHITNDAVGSWTQSNVIAGHESGIAIRGDDRNDGHVFHGNTFRANRVLHVDLHPLGVHNENDLGDQDRGPNDRQNYPELSWASTDEIRAMTCPGCEVRVYRATGRSGHQPETVGAMVGQGWSRFGVAEVPLEGVEPGTALTMLATGGGTSEFSPVFWVR